MYTRTNIENIEVAAWQFSKYKQMQFFNKSPMFFFFSHID